MMATISGLQSPNPYAQPVSRAKPVSQRSAETAGSTQALSYHAEYSPDWMQAEHVSQQAGSPALYGAKGELQKLPAEHSSTSEPVNATAALVDQVSISNEFYVNFASLPGTGKSK